MCIFVILIENLVVVRLFLLFHMLEHSSKGINMYDSWISEMRHTEWMQQAKAFLCALYFKSLNQNECTGMMNIKQSKMLVAQDITGGKLGKASSHPLASELCHHTCNETWQLGMLCHCKPTCAFFLPSHRNKLMKSWLEAKAVTAGLPWSKPRAWCDWKKKGSHLFSSCWWSQHLARQK